jgi:hypothetical protein
MNTQEDEFRRIEREALRRAQAAEDDDTQSYTSEAYRCGYEAGAVAEREACAKVADGWPDYDVQGLAEAIRARGTK